MKKPNFFIRHIRAMNNISTGRPWKDDDIRVSHDTLNAIKELADREQVETDSPSETSIIRCRKCRIVLAGPLRAAGLNKAEWWEHDRSPSCHEIVRLRTILVAIDALPDDSPHDPVLTPSYLHGYREAMRQVKALIHPEGANDHG